MVNKHTNNTNNTNNTNSNRFFPTTTMSPMNVSQPVRVTLRQKARYYGMGYEESKKASEEEMNEFVETKREEERRRYETKMTEERKKEMRMV